MNQRTAKLLRKHAVLTRSNYRKHKQNWVRLPKSKRAQIRQELKATIEELK